MSVDPWDPALVDWADKVAFSVPMHTATRMARASSPAGIAAPICCYGLYARHVRRRRRRRDRRRVRSRRSWLGRARRARRDGPARARRPPAPDAPLPPATCSRRSTATPQLVDGDAARGSSARSRPADGCAHRCRHCPVPVVYDGRVRIADDDAVLADIDQLVAAGATPHHVRRPRLPQRAARTRCGSSRAMHDAFPDAHVRLHREGRARAAARRRVARARRRRVHVRGVGVRVGQRRDPRAARQGTHRRRRGARGRAAARPTAIDVRPSFLPFTPWTTRDDIVALLDFVHDARPRRKRRSGAVHDPAAAPRGSLLLDPPGSRAPPRRVGRRADSPTRGTRPTPRSTSCSSSSPRSSRRAATR